jgi:hypothetical protein
MKLSVVKVIVLWALVGLIAVSACCGQTVNRFVVDGSYVATYKAFPPQALRPVTYGFQEVEFVGDCTAASFNPIQPAKFIGGTGNKLGAALIQGLDGASFTGLNVYGAWQCREAWTAGSPVCKNCTWKDCKFFAQLRIRFGCFNITIEDSEWQRRGPIPTADVIGLYFSDYASEASATINVRRCTFSGFTDGIQFGCKDDTFRRCFDATVSDCLFYVPGEYLNDDGSMQAGIENGLDGKVGKLSLLRNRYVGFRPSVYSGGGGPGYPLTFHVGISDVLSLDERIIDCEAGIHLAYDGDREIYFDGLSAVGVRNHGFPTQWTSKQGSVICGTGSAKFCNVHWIDCDRLEEYPNHPNTQPPRQFTDCGGL